MSVIVVTADFARSLGSMVAGYSAPIAAMIAISMVLCPAIVTETWIN